MNTSHFMTIPLLAMHMIYRLHFSSAELATVMVLNLLCAQALPFAAGILADRWGARRMIILGLWLRGGGFLGFGLLDGALAWMVCACVAGTGVACYEGGVYGILGRQKKALLPAIFAMNNQMLNIGTALGPLVGGMAGLGDARFAFGASAAVFGGLGSAALRGRFGGPDTGAPRAMRDSARRAFTHRGLWRVALLSLPWFFLFPQLYVAFPLYAGRIAGPHAASAVYVVNGVVGLGFMLAMRRRLTRMNLAKMIAGAYLAAAIAFASVPLLHDATWFLLFIAAYTVIETLLMPAFETLVGTLAMAGSEATFFGAVSAVGALASGAGYYVGSWLILHRPAVEAWAVFGGVGLLGVVLSRLLLPLPRSISSQ